MIIVGISIKNKYWLEIPIALDPRSVPVAKIPANPVPVLTSPISSLGYPFKKPRNTASPNDWEIP